MQKGYITMSIKNTYLLQPKNFYAKVNTKHRSFLHNFSYRVTGVLQSIPTGK